MTTPPERDLLSLNLLTGHHVSPDGQSFRGIRATAHDAEPREEVFARARAFLSP